MLTAMALSVPSPRTTNPLARIREDLGIEWRASRRGPLPPGSKLPSLVLTERMRRDPLAVLLTAYEEHGPIFAIRIFHGIQVFMLGPEANRYILVTDRDKFRWRDGNLGDLIPLIGDGLLTTDGEYHDRARQTMLPVFHRRANRGGGGRDERGGRTSDDRLERGRARRPLRLDPPRGDAGRHARAVRLRPGPLRRRRRRHLRAGALLL